MLEFLLYDAKASAGTSVHVKANFLVIWQSERLYTRRGGSHLSLALGQSCKAGARSYWLLRYKQPVTSSFTYAETGFLV